MNLMSGKQQQKRYVFDIDERKHKHTQKKHIIALKYFDMTQK
jgi:hypothetical protein